LGSADKPLLEEISLLTLLDKATDHASLDATVTRDRGFHEAQSLLGDGFQAHGHGVEVTKVTGMTKDPLRLVVVVHLDTTLGGEVEELVVDGALFLLLFREARVDIRRDNLALVRRVEDDLEDGTLSNRPHRAKDQVAEGLTNGVLEAGERVGGQDLDCRVTKLIGKLFSLGFGGGLSGRC
jgi:hypothetical protein